MTAQPNPARVGLTIHGRVQRVAYRYHTARTARRLGVVGWVRNDPEGTVTLVAEGPREQLAALIEWCREGPPMARVEHVDAQWTAARGDLGQEFRIAR